MQPAVVNLLGNTPQQAAGALTLKLLSGDVTAIPLGSVVRATVTAVADGKADLTLNGQPVTVRAQPSLTVGTDLAVRVTAGGIEAVVIPPGRSPNPTGPTPAAPPAAPVVVAQPRPPTAPPPASIPVAQLAVAPATSPPLVQQPATEGSLMPTADGTVAATSTSVPAPARVPTAVAPAPPPAGQPVAVAPNVPVRTANPTAAQPATPPPTGQPSPAQARSPQVGPPPPEVVPLPSQKAPPALAPRPRYGQPGVVNTPPPLPQTAPAPPPSRTIPAPRPGPRPAADPPQLSVVEVMAPNRGGVPQVRVDGRPPVAAESPVPLTPGEKVIAQVVRTAQGVRIIPAPAADTPQATTAVVAAILKQDRPPPVGDALPRLVRELATVPATAAVRPAEPVAAKSAAVPVRERPEVVQAAADLRDAVRAVLPDTPRPPTAGELKSLVEDGGQRYEAKLGRQTDGGDGPGPLDLKGGLLKLFEAVPAFAHAQFPAAKATLDGIEQQQAANVLSQQTGGPLVLQVPFPDGPHWRTLHLAVEPDQSGGDAADEQSRPFRMLMHVPLSDLGDTWIDAGMNGGQFRAVLYLDRAAVRDRVRGELPSLQSDLKQSGFTEVLLDVRPTADLTDRQKQRGAAMAAGVPVSTTVIDARA